jgi:hypothetical protein
VKALLLSLLGLLGASPSPARTVLGAILSILDSPALSSASTTAATLVQSLADSYTDLARQKTSDTNSDLTRLRTDDGQTSRDDLTGSDLQTSGATVTVTTEASVPLAPRGTLRTDCTRDRPQPRPRTVRTRTPLAAKKSSKRLTTWFQCNLCEYVTPRSHDMWKHLGRKHGKEVTSFDTDTVKFRSTRTRAPKTPR